MTDPADATTPARQTSPVRAGRLIWLIVLLGLVTSGFTLFKVRAALWGIADQRARLAAVLNDVDSMSKAVDRSYADAEDAMQRHLALRPKPGPDGVAVNPVVGMLDNFIASANGRDAKSRIDQVKSFLAALNSLDGQCIAWSREYRECQAALDERKKEVDAALLGLTVALTQADGRQRLDLALNIRKFRKQSGEAANESARQIVGGLKPGSDLNDLATEASTLAALVERITGEDELDRLAELKDNTLAASLFRLTPIVARCGATLPDLERDARASLAAFQKAVLGDGYKVDVEHQTVSPGSGGLYLQCRQRMQLRQRREELRERTARCGEQYKDASGEVDASYASLRDKLGSETESMLVSHWHTLLFVCLASGAALALLGNVIAVTIKR